MDEYKYDIKIPKERVAVLIGKKGETKRLIENETATKIEVDSQEGDVTISGWFRLNSPFSPSSSTSLLIMEKHVTSNIADDNMHIALVGTDYGSSSPTRGSLVFKIENSVMCNKSFKSFIMISGQPKYRKSAVTGTYCPNSFFINKFFFFQFINS